MIAPDITMDLGPERRFDLVASVLIGVIAVLAAVLAVVQMNTNQAASRADLQAARLEADLSARISVSGQALGASLVAEQTALMLGLEATGRQLSAARAGDDTALAVGGVEQQAYEQLQAILTATVATSGGSPLDAYTAGLVNATVDQMKAEAAEQSRQVDVANDQSWRSQWASLGLSFLALAGVLTGLAAVLRQGRPGWASLGAAGLINAGAVLMVIVAVV